MLQTFEKFNTIAHNITSAECDKLHRQASDIADRNQRFSRAPHADDR